MAWEKLEEYFMKCAGKFACAMALVLSLTGAGRAQLGLFTPEQRIDFTRAWKGDRFADGRPRVPDSVLQGMKTVSAEEAWGVLRGAGFRTSSPANGRNSTARPGAWSGGRSPRVSCH